MEHISGMARLAKDFTLNILIAIGVLRAREPGRGRGLPPRGQLEKLGIRWTPGFSTHVLPSPRWPTRFRDLEFAVAVPLGLRRQPQQYDVVISPRPLGCVYGLSRKWFPSVELPPYVFTMQGSEESSRGL